MKHYGSFSQAIREGAKLRDQAFGNLLVDGKTCAIGAGLEAIGYADVGEAWIDATKKYPYMSAVGDVMPCPANCDNTRRRLYQMVVHLNDDHRWKREAIADWLEQEEEKLGFVTITESVEQPKSSLLL